MKQTLTRHAQVRMQQRGIPPVVVDLLLDYGAVEHDHLGATRYSFNKRSLKRVKSYLGPRLARYANQFRDCAVVLSDDGVVITAIHRIH